jgi:hypothetical protein
MKLYFEDGCLRDRPDDGGSNYLWNIVNVYQTTRRYNLEDSHLHTRRRENLESYKVILYLGLLQSVNATCIFLCSRKVEFKKTALYV